MRQQNKVKERCAESFLDDFAWLLPSVAIENLERHVLLSDYKTDWKPRGDKQTLLNSLLALDGSRRTSELTKRATGIGQLLRALDRRGWLVHLSRSIEAIVKDRPELSRQLAYFAHLQRIYPDHAIDELAASSALIIGVGGIGSHVAFSLAGSGVGHLILDDPDVIEASNLNRQVLYTRADIGKRKVDVAARALKARFSRIRVDTIATNSHAIRHSKLPRASAVIVCGERRQIWDKPWLVGATPFLAAAYFGRHAVVGPCIDPSQGGTCWACLMRYSERVRISEAELRWVKQRRGWNPSGATVNAMAGSLTAEAALRLLAPSLGRPLLMNERLEIDMATLKTSRLRFDPGRIPGQPCYCRPQ